MREIDIERLNTNRVYCIITMVETIANDDEVSRVKEIARESANFTEPMCRECFYDRGHEHDPLGGTTHTPARKEINEMGREIGEKEGFGPMGQDDVIRELEEIFYEEFQEQVKENKLVPERSCFYCRESGRIEIYCSASDIVDMRQ